MATTNKTANQGKSQPIIIERTFDLPLNTLWKAWTEPESYKKWWGPRDFTCPSCTIDLRVGGKYVSCMRSSDGKDFWGTGKFMEIIPRKKLVYEDSFADSNGNIVPASHYNMPGEWPEVTMVTVELEEVGGKTRMQLTHEGIPEEMQDDCIDGWQESFDKMEENLR